MPALYDPSVFAILGVAFWAFVAICVVAGVWYYYARNRSTQKTIRLAIEKGMQLDPELVEKLIRGKSGNPTDYYIGGICSIAAGLGLPIMGYFIGKIAIEAYYPLVGAGILAGLIGIGLIICGKVMSSSEED